MPESTSIASSPRLQKILQSRRLQLPMTGEELALSRQPQDNQLSVSERGHVSFNARNGARDDLVIALAPSVD